MDYQIITVQGDNLEAAVAILRHQVTEAFASGWVVQGGVTFQKIQGGPFILMQAISWTDTEGTERA